MSDLDRLDRVEQQFESNFDGYVGPMEAAAGSTGELAGTVEELNGVLGELGATSDAAGASLAGAAAGARDLTAGSGEARDVLAELGATADDAAGQLGGLSGSEDDTAAATGALAETQRGLRDAILEADPAIDSQAASLLADAAAMRALGLSSGFADSQIRDMPADIQALHAALSALSQDELRTLSGGAAGRDELDAGAALAGMRASSLSADESFLSARGALDDYQSKLSTVAGLLKDTDSAAADAAASLETVGEDASDGLDLALPKLSNLNLQAIGIGSALALAVGPAVGVATSLGAMGAAAAFAYPDLRQVFEILSGKKNVIPGDNAVTQAVGDIRQLQAEFSQLSSSSGVGQNLVGTALPEAIQAADNLLRDMVPLAKAGATSIDEIAAAAERVTGSSGFRDFLGQLAQQAPGDTNAILNLAGAVGGALKDAFTTVGPSAAADMDELSLLVKELSGPVAGALGDIAVVAGGVTGAVSGGIGILKGGGDTVAALGKDITGNAHEAGQSWHEAGQQIKQPDVLTFLGALFGETGQVKAGAEGAAGAMARQSDEEHRAAAEASSFASEMATASGNAGTLASRVSALGTALASEGSTTATSLGAIAAFHQGLTTLEADMTASANRAGYLTAAQQATAAEFAQMYTLAVNASQGLLATGSSADHAAGPLEALRGEMEKIQDPTAAEKELLRELNAEIDALHSKTIVIGVRTVDEGTSGQPLPVSGGPTGHPQGGPDALTPGFVVAPHVGGRSGAAEIHVHVPVSVHPAVGALTSPEFLLGLAPVIEEAVLRHAQLNQSSGLHFGGFTRAF